MANINTEIDGKDSRQGLRERHKVKKILPAQPLATLHHLALYEWYHSVAATDSEEAYLEKGEKTLEVKIHLVTSIIAFFCLIVGWLGTSLFLFLSGLNWHILRLFSSIRIEIALVVKETISSLKD
jgi:hypothetical protein